MVLDMPIWSPGKGPVDSPSGDCWGNPQPQCLVIRPLDREGVGEKRRRPGTTTSVRKAPREALGEAGREQGWQGCHGRQVGNGRLGGLGGSSST